MFGEVLSMLGYWWSSQGNGKLLLLWSSSWGLIYLEVFSFFWSLALYNVHYYMLMFFHYYIQHLTNLYLFSRFLVNGCTSATENISVNCDTRVYVIYFLSLCFFLKIYFVFSLLVWYSAKQQTVQDVIDNLHISKLEYRSETDPDVISYVHDRKIELIQVVNAYLFGI